MDTRESLASVAGRLNRAATLRALSWTLGSAGVAVAGAAAAAGNLPPAAFRLALGGIVVAVAAVAIGAALLWRSRRADTVAAARWIEKQVPLEQRLLTFASAPAGAHDGRLWPDLEADNREHGGLWVDSSLGIPRVPASTLFLVAGIALAFATLWPSSDAPVPPPEIGAARTETPEAAGAEGFKPPGEGGTVSQGLAGAEGDGAGAGTGAAVAAGAVTATVDAMRSDLAARFDRSIAAKALDRMGSGGAPGGTGQNPQLATRAKPERGGVGSTKSEAGGRRPDESMSRLEQDDGGSGQPVRAAEPEGGTGSGRPSQAGSNPQGAGQEGGKGQSQGGGAGKAQPGGRGKPDDPKVASDAGGAASGKASGAGAGAGKATSPVLAPKALSLTGDRQTARFALTIGAGTKAGTVGEGEGVPTQARSHIAEGTRGEQAADRSVRREQIPPEYESVIKRIFEREP